MAYIDRQQIEDYLKIGADILFKSDFVIKEFLEKLYSIPIADVVPRSEVEELQKKLNDYERVVGKLSFTVDGVATLLIGENVEYIDKQVAEGFKNMAVKQAEQKVAREIFEKIENLMNKRVQIIHGVVLISKYDVTKLRKEYIGE